MNKILNFANDCKMSGMKFIRKIVLIVFLPCVFAAWHDIGSILNRGCNYDVFHTAQSQLSQSSDNDVANYGFEANSLFIPPIESSQYLNRLENSASYNSVFHYLPFRDVLKCNYGISALLIAAFGKTAFGTKTTDSIYMFHKLRI